METCHYQDLDYPRKIERCSARMWTSSITRQLPSGNEDEKKNISLLSEEFSMLLIFINISPTGLKNVEVSCFSNSQLQKNNQVTLSRIIYYQCQQFHIIDNLCESLLINMSQFHYLNLSFGCVCEAFHPFCRFDELLKTAVLLNTRGTKQMIELAKEMKNLLLFVHISTAYCHLEEKVCI